MKKIGICFKAQVLVLMGLIVNPVQAYDCVLDTNGDGVADGTSGANSSSHIFRVACGNNATASGSNSTALGYSSTASGSASTAVGTTSGASGSASTAVGVGSGASGTSSTAMGVGSGASGLSSTALGRDSTASDVDSTALGRSSTASARNTTALGRSSHASGTSSTALGTLSNASGEASTTMGSNSRSASFGAVSVGYAAGLNAFSPPTDSPQAIAIGHYSNISTAAPGAIAIGGDVDGDLKGAEATAPGAIAIGADVVADKANTMTVGVPIEVVRDDGTSNFLIEETNATVAVRTLGELANNGGVRLRFNNMALGEEWDFTSNQSGGFQFSLVGSGGAELSVGTNGTVRMGPGPISNLTLFPSGNMTIEGILTENSDRNSKQQITELDHESILDKISALSIHEWEYKDSPDQRHIGPMAQDFHQAFNLGEDNKHIASLDMAGVALASIQALIAENQQIKTEKDQQITELKIRLDELELKLALLLN